MDRSQGEDQEPGPWTAADHLRREGPHGAVVDRERVLQAAAAQQGRHGDRGDAQARPRSHDRQRLAGGRRHRARIRDAEAFADALGPWVAGARVEVFPAWEVLPGEAMSPTLDTMGRRLRILWELAGGGAETLPKGTPPLRIIVTSVRAYLQQVGAPPTEALHLETGTVIDLEDLERRLTALGYERNYLVERPGEFSVRGGILDVYPPGAAPVRADFFGDEITSLRAFSIGSQRSLAETAGVDILPARELLLGPQEGGIARESRKSF